MKNISFTHKFILFFITLSFIDALLLGSKITGMFLIEAISLIIFYIAVVTLYRIGVYLNKTF